MNLEEFLNIDRALRDEVARSQSFILPGARPHYNPDRPGQVEHIFLDLHIQIPHRSFGGTCTITINPIRDGIKQLTLNAVDLEIHSVQIDEVEQKFTYDREYLYINLHQPTITGQLLKVTIAYSVENPQRGLYFIHPDQHYPNKPTQVWTQGEDEDSRYWFPCFDYPGQLSTSEIRVRVPKPMLAVSNGTLINKVDQGDEHIFHWLQQEVHPTYLMALAVGDFAEIKDQWHGKQVTYYVEKSRVDDARRSMGKTPQMMEYLSEKFGYPYPYPKYAQICVDDFIFGGMENTSATILTDRCLLDERAALDNRSTESLVVHELCHQWFGDLIVIKHWAHAWIKEGMASYSEVLWTEFTYGRDSGAYYLLNEARSYLSEDSCRYRRPLVTHIYREAIELYDRHIYEKGACVYHMIRAELGEELFWSAIQTFVRDHAFQSVETIDLLRAIEKATGRNLLFLFDQYVFRGGHPDFKVAYSWDQESKLAKLTITQTQAKPDQNVIQNDLFDLKIPIGFGYKDQPSKTITIRVNSLEQSFYFPLETQPDFISFDQGNNYLKTVELAYPLPELKAQLQFDPDPISRIYAAQAIAQKGNLEAVKALAQALTQDPFWGVRAEVATELAKIKLNQASDALLEGLTDTEARVRRAVILALGTAKPEAAYAKIKQLLIAGDRSYYTEATAASVLGKIVANTPHSQEAIELLQKILQERAGWNETVRSGAISGLAQLKNEPQTFDIINEYTVLGVSQPLRLASIRALGTIQTPTNQDRILSRLEELAKETFFLTQMAVVNALSQIETTKAISLLQSIAHQSPDGRVKRYAEESIQQVQAKVGSSQALKQLREELDELKKENQNLKSRLENLEAKS